MRIIRSKAILASAVALLAIASPALAGRGGFGGRGGGGFRGGGGGFRGGGGGFRGGNFGGGNFGGFRGGGTGGASSFNRTPGFNAGGFDRNRVNNFNANGGLGNRGGFNDANRFGVGNRPEIGNNANRFDNRNFDGNRLGNNTINAGNRFDGNRFDNTNVNNFGNRANVSIQNRSYGYGHWRNPAYNRGWVHGYWNGWNAGAWNNAGWFGLGAGLGWGLSSWSYGPWLYHWGYSGYSNPYYAVAPPNGAQAPAYDYAQPIDTTAAPPDQAINDAATATFDQARASFLAGDYEGALERVNQALKQIPDDSALHEFRALCEFATGRYDDAAVSLFAVLSVGPGWDWTTLISLYPSVDTYTAQLRALEAYCKGHEASASSHFVLGYHYMTENFSDAAAKQFAMAAKINPADTLSAQLAEHLTTEADPNASAPSPTPAPAPAELAASAMPAGASLSGRWAASPAEGTTIGLTIGDDNTFTWTIQRRGGNRTMTGNAAYENGLLTLDQGDGPPLVGRVTWTDATHMTFRVDGGPSGDPGLLFAKS